MEILLFLSSTTAAITEMSLGEDFVRILKDSGFDVRLSDFYFSRIISDGIEAKTRDICDRTVTSYYRIDSHSAEWVLYFKMVMGSADVKRAFPVIGPTIDIYGLTQMLNRAISILNISEQHADFFVSISRGWWRFNFNVLRMIDEFPEMLRHTSISVPISAPAFERFLLIFKSSISQIPPREAMMYEEFSHMRFCPNVRLHTFGCDVPFIARRLLYTDEVPIGESIRVLGRFPPDRQGRPTEYVSADIFSGEKCTLGSFSQDDLGAFIPEMRNFTSQSLEFTFSPPFVLLCRLYLSYIVRFNRMFPNYANVDVGPMHGWNPVNLTAYNDAVRRSKHMKLQRLIPKKTCPNLLGQMCCLRSEGCLIVFFGGYPRDYVDDLRSNMYESILSVEIGELRALAYHARELMAKARHGVMSLCGVTRIPDGKPHLPSVLSNLILSYVIGDEPSLIHAEDYILSGRERLNDRSITHYCLNSVLDPGDDLIDELD